ncbi:MAG: ABC transporter permease [Bacteroidota bacterium]|nr:ABC transporter permease [Bacteroidota bacterium]
MAWRESRKNWSRLLLFISSMVLGIAALVAIYSLGNNLNDEINNQAAGLLGADLEISSNQPASAKMEHLMDSLGGQRSQECNFASMVLFLKGQGTRLVQVRALQGNFPYYGSIETFPASAGKSFRENQAALVDKTLMLQYGGRLGDTIRVGEINFVIAGQLTGAPGQTGFSSSIAPIVYIPLKYLDQTGLLKKGSRISYHYYFKFPPGFNVEALVAGIKDQLESNEMRYDTVETQKRDSGRYFSDLTKFLLLVGFIALLLGSSGVASAVYVHVREKKGTIAILRCLGLRSYQAFLIFLIQVVAAGIIGSFSGIVLGVIIQQFLPMVLKDFLPVSISTHLSWIAIGEGFSIGIVVSVLFALMPLLSIRKVSPLLAIRASVERVTQKRDPLSWVVYIATALAIYGFTWMQMKNSRQAMFFTLGIGISILVLYAIAQLLMWLVRHFFPSAWNYVWRQGLANLYRPNNQTVILITSIGLGTALICTLFFVQSLIVSRITLSASKDQPNMVLFDIQTQQREAVLDLARKFNLPAQHTVPIVNMRLMSINGITAEEARKDSTIQFPHWLFDREYRVTYRDSLTTSEKITKGKWEGVANPSSLPSISLEQNYAERTHLEIGDTLVFNVQGVEMATRIGSYRQVNWGGIRTNFLVVFPKGTLEAAPQFHVLLTRVPSDGVSAKFQEAVVRQFPNVSIIDLALVLNVLNELLGKISFVIRFMAGFSILTGLVVLIASVFISKYKRIEEIVLLRTLGASKKKVLGITALEYGFLGALAALCGILLALGASWALAHYSFNLEFKPNLAPALLVFLAVSLLTIITGVLNSLGFFKSSPLEVLRQE